VTSSLASWLLASSQYIAVMMVIRVLWYLPELHLHRRMLLHVS